MENTITKGHETGNRTGLIEQNRFFASSLFVTCAGLFLLAFAIRVGLLLATKSYLDREHSELVLVATSLAQGHGFANAFGDTGPTAHMSPVYPFLLSLIYRYFGTGTTGEVAQELFSCFLASLTWGLIPLIGEVCGLDRRIGVFAAFIGAILTINRWAETKGSSEAAMAGLACLITFLCFMRCWYSRDFSLRAAALTGVISGLAISISATLASIVIGFLIAGFLLFHRASSRSYWRFASVCTLCIVATLSPWAIRNYFALGSLVWTRSNLPLELMVSNNDYAQPTLMHNEQSGYRYHPFMSPFQRSLIKSMGEIAYQRKLRNEVFEWIGSHPQRFTMLTLERIYYFWIPEMKRPIQTACLGFMFLTSIPALIVLLRQHQLFAFGIVTIWLTYPAVYYVIQTHPRYVYPMQWTLYYLSSAGIIFLAAKLRAGGSIWPDSAAVSKR